LRVPSQAAISLREEGVVVERADMVKGYEFAKDQYVTFTPEELKEMEEKGDADDRDQRVRAR
jgi:non-homologous end joining protein Ku